jgi:hypothetical protein
MVLGVAAVVFDAKLRGWAVLPKHAWEADKAQLQDGLSCAPYKQGC